jgi:hypothetical protein
VDEHVEGNDEEPALILVQVLLALMIVFPMMVQNHQPRATVVTTKKEFPCYTDLVVDVVVVDDDDAEVFFVSC